MSCPQIPEPHPDNKTTSSKVQDVPRGPAGKALIALLLKRDAEGSPLLYFTKWTGSPVAFAFHQVRAALRRIELGIYGICVVDGCPIDEQQLNAVPWIHTAASTNRCSRDPHPDALAAGAGLRR